MPARIEPHRTVRSRFGSTCAKWLRVGALALAGSSLTLACVLNPKTDDLPGSTANIPDLPDGIQGQPGGGNASGDDDGPELLPTDPEQPPNLGEEPRPSDTPPDAGTEANDTRPADAGSELADSFSRDSGLDAE